MNRFHKKIDLCYIIYIRGVLKTSPVTLVNPYFSMVKLLKVGFLKNPIKLFLFVLLFRILTVCSISMAATMLPEDVLSKIRNYKIEKGIPASFETVFDYLPQLSPETITNDLIKSLTAEVRKQQNSTISKEQILHIIESKRISMRDFSSQYNVDIEKFDLKGSLLSKETNTYTFAFSKNKYSLENLNEKIKRTFDGEKLVTQQNLNDSDLPSVGISNLETRSWFFQPWSPLASAMLLDTKLLNFDHDYYDIVLFLKKYGSVVYEKHENFDGVDCLVVASLSQKYYLDINRDFTVIGKKNFRHIIMPVNGKPILTGRYLDTLSKLKNLKDYGNSLWFPLEVLNEYYNKNKVLISKELISTNFINVNTGEDGINISIPDNALVSDVTRGLVYKYGERVSIDSLLENTVKSKRVFIYRYISVISGLVLIFIVLVIKYRQYLKDKRERKNRAEEETK